MLRTALLATALIATPAFAQDAVHTATQRQMPALMDFYRDFHAHPELSLHETQSAAKLAEQARAAGFEVTENFGGTGVVAVMRNGPGPVLLIRADIDALPVTEDTGLPFASKVRTTTAEGVETGVMHACGHDTHMATWIGTLRNMALMKDKWHGTLIMIAQPAEEVGVGAGSMLDAGLFTKFPKPSVAIAFHDSASLPAGVIGMHPGYAMANVDWVDINVKGVGGHGAYPHLTKDPIVLASRIVVTLQTLVSRETDPQESAVVTVGSFHGGQKPNIIPESAFLQLTIRSYKPEVRKNVLEGIARIARGEGIAAGMPDDRMPEVITKPGFTPAVYNTEPLADHMTALFTSRFGAARVQQVPASMAGEDFSRYYLADKSIQSLLFWVGGVPKAAWDASDGGRLPLPSLHSSKWAPDAEAVIGTATEAMTAAALDVLRK